MQETFSFPSVAGDKIISVEYGKVKHRSGQATYFSDNILLIVTDKHSIFINEREDCRYHSWVEDGLDDAQYMVGDTISSFEERIVTENNDEGFSREKFYFYHLTGHKNDAILRWLCESSQYYAASVNIEIKDLIPGVNDSFAALQEAADKRAEKEIEEQAVKQRSLLEQQKVINLAKVKAEQNIHSAFEVLQSAFKEIQSANGTAQAYKLVSEIAEKQQQVYWDEIRKQKERERKEKERKEKEAKKMRQSLFLPSPLQAFKMYASDACPDQNDKLRAIALTDSFVAIDFALKFGSSANNFDELRKIACRDPKAALSWFIRVDEAFHQDTFDAVSNSKDEKLIASYKKRMEQGKESS